MDVVQKRIKICLDHGNTELDLSYMKLKRLPPNLPNFIQILYCHNNQLSELPKNLPTSLRELHCQNNLINKMPSCLPAYLEKLYISNNNIRELPSNLPDSLKVLFCCDNEIEELSLNLPIGIECMDISRNRIKKFQLNRLSSLIGVYCDDNLLTDLPPNLITVSPLIIILTCLHNKYLHIPKKYALHFNIDETPNYNKMASCIQQIWRVKKCKQIMIGMMQNNNNVLYDSFRFYGDINIIQLIVQFIY